MGHEWQFGLVQEIEDLMDSVSEKLCLIVGMTTYRSISMIHVGKCSIQK